MTYNFCAGPAVLPQVVLEQCQRDLVDYQGLGLSVLSLSHRSDRFAEMADRARSGLRKLLAVPDSHEILFLTHSGTDHFSMIPLNFLGHRQALYLDTGFWSSYAYQQALLYGEPHQLISLKPEISSNGRSNIPKVNMPNACAYVHLTSNETIEGIQYRQFPRLTSAPQHSEVALDSGVSGWDRAFLAADMSSDILTREINFDEFGLVYAAAQKNIGPSGFSVVILKKDLDFCAGPTVPPLYQYQNHMRARSLMNTPNVFGWYVSGLMFDWVLAQGGVPEMAKRAQIKSQALYQAIDHSGFYENTIREDLRSQTVVTFDIPGHIEVSVFVDEAEKAGLFGLRGHRRRGGLRAALYNAMPMEGVHALIDFMKAFERKYG